MLAFLLLVVLAGFVYLRGGEQAAVEAPATPAITAELPDRVQARTEPVQAASVAPREEVEAPRVSQEVRPRPLTAERKPARVERPESRPAGRRDAKIAGGPEFFESEPAVLLSVPAAGYPEAAQGSGASAEIVVGLTIDETGSVRTPTIETSRVRGSGPESAFEEAALTAARQARFHPARERGLPVSSWSTLTFTFAATSPGPDA